MNTVWHIFQGIGIATAVGVRPFLPALVVGVLAAAGAETGFAGTDLSFLQSAWFLILLLVLALALAVAERRLGGRLDAASAWGTLGVLGAALGALLFAAVLAHGHDAEAPGYVGGVLCALVGLAATRPLFARVRARLDRDAAAAVPFYAEGAGVALAALSVLLPPAGPIGLVLLVWLLVRGRRREGQKYAGLRILR